MAQRGESRGFSSRPKILDLLGAGTMHEDDARAVARDLVRAARSSTDRNVEGPAPEPDEVRERREARLRRESRQET